MMTAVEQLEQTIRDKDLRNLRRMMMQKSSPDEIAVMAVILLELIGSVIPPDQLPDVFQWLHQISVNPPRAKLRLKQGIRYHDE